MCVEIYQVGVDDRVEVLDGHGHEAEDLEAGVGDLRPGAQQFRAVGRLAVVFDRETFGVVNYWLGSWANGEVVGAVDRVATGVDLVVGKVA